MGGRLLHRWSTAALDGPLGFDPAMAASPLTPATAEPGVERDADGLITLGGPPPPTRALVEIWNRRYFASALARSEVRSANLGTLLGQTWQVLNPAFMIAVYFVIFGLVLDARRGVEHYVTFLVAGVIVFRFAQSTITGCASSLARNLGLLRSLQFPRSLIPIAQMLEQLYALIPGLALVLIVAAIDGVRPGLELLALPIVLAATAAFTLGLGFATARAATTVPDLVQIMPHAFRVLLYISGVLFSVDAFIETDWIRSLFALNPFYAAITAARWSILGIETSPAVALSLIVWSLGALGSGWWWFRRGEHRYGA